MSNHRTKSIDENSVEYMERMSNLALRFVEEYKTNKPLPYEAWEWRRDMLLVQQGKLVALRTVISITDAVPDIELLNKAEAALAHTAAWIKINKLRNTNVRSKRPKTKRA